MIITDIIAVDKKRDKVFIDNEFAFVLYKGELHLYNIEIGNSLEETTYNHIMNEVLVKRAKLRAMNLLTKRDYTEVQLRTKLVQGFYQEEIIDKALEYVKSYGYLDDERYVRDYFAIHILTKPKKMIIQKLVEKGVSLELIESIVEDIYEQESSLIDIPDEYELGRQLLAKKKYSFTDSSNDKQKAYAYLIRKGISSDNVMKLLKEY